MWTCYCKLIVLSGIKTKDYYYSITIIMIIVGDFFVLLFPMFIPLISLTDFVLPTFGENGHSDQQTLLVFIEVEGRGCINKIFRDVPEMYFYIKIAENLNFSLNSFYPIFENDQCMFIL